MPPGRPVDRYDGWLLSYRPGRPALLRQPLLCVDTRAQRSGLHRFLCGVRRPAIFRLLPFSAATRARHGWRRAGWLAFNTKCHVSLDDVPAGTGDPGTGSVEIVESRVSRTCSGAAWRALPEIRAWGRAARSYPYRTRDVAPSGGEVVACGLVDSRPGAGLFDSPRLRCAMGPRAIDRVGAAGARAAQRGAHTAYLQVTAKRTGTASTSASATPATDTGTARPGAAMRRRKGGLRARRRHVLPLSTTSPPGWTNSPWHAVSCSRGGIMHRRRWRAP
jgi:hypothetical protein